VGGGGSGEMVRKVERGGDDVFGGGARSGGGHGVRQMSVVCVRVKVRNTSSLVDMDCNAFVCV
jgi:hypothetical protein